MVESVSVSGGKQELSEDARLCLVQTLNALPRTQFDELIFALKPPSGNIPPSESAPQSSRSMALLAWAESPIGPGLLQVEKLLSKIISTHAKTAEQYLAFVISGKINSSTADELQAFVKLLRKKTGDNSIDIAFFEEGSIKVVLSGSSEGLAKLQELFDSGELEQLDIRPVESVTTIEANTQEARKARLIQVLRSREPCTTPTQLTDLTLRFLDQAITSAISIDHELKEVLAIQRSRILYLTIAITAIIAIILAFTIAFTLNDVRPIIAIAAALLPIAIATAIAVASTRRIYVPMFFDTEHYYFVIGAIGLALILAIVTVTVQQTLIPVLGLAVALTPVARIAIRGYRDYERRLSSHREGVIARYVALVKKDHIIARYLDFKRYSRRFKASVVQRPGLSDLDSYRSNLDSYRYLSRDLDGYFRRYEFDHYLRYPPQEYYRFYYRHRYFRQDFPEEEYYYLDRNFSCALDRSLSRELDRYLSRKLDRYFRRSTVRYQGFDLERGLDLERSLDMKCAHDLAIRITENNRILIDKTICLNLEDANLSGANLRDMNLRGVDLTGADLTYADVTGTLFGDNPGLTDADKRDLQSRGAIFHDPPSSDVPVLMRR